MPMDSPVGRWAVAALTARGSADAAHRVVQLVTDSIPRALGIPADQVQVVTPVHRGGAGTQALNAALTSDDPQRVAQARAAIDAAQQNPPPRFVDAIPDKPLMRAVYQRDYALELVGGTGWALTWKAFQGYVMAGRAPAGWHGGVAGVPARAQIDDRRGVSAPVLALAPPGSHRAGRWPWTRLLRHRYGGRSSR